MFIIKNMNIQDFACKVSQKTVTKKISRQCLMAEEEDLHRAAIRTTNPAFKS